MAENMFNIKLTFRGRGLKANSTIATWTSGKKKVNFSRLAAPHTGIAPYRRTDKTTTKIPRHYTTQLTLTSSGGA